MKSLIYTMVLCASISLGARASAQSYRVSDIPVTADSVDLKTYKVQMASFGMSLDELLSSENDEHREAALRQIIRDGEATDYSREDVLKVVRIYRDHENDNMRRMAVVALGEMHDGWAIDFLARSAHFEKTPQVLHTVVSVLADHGTPAVPQDQPAIARKTD